MNLDYSTLTTSKKKKIVEKYPFSYSVENRKYVFKLEFS